MIYCFHVLDLQPEPKTTQKKQNEFYTNEGIVITLKTGSITTETVSCNRAREVSVHNRLDSGRSHFSSIFMQFAGKFGRLIGGRLPLRLVSPREILDKPLIGVGYNLEGSMLTT